MRSNDADPWGTRWRPWPLTWEWRHRRMRSLLALTHVEQDGGHGNWRESDVIGACTLYLRLPTWNKMAAMAIDVRVTSSAHALSIVADPRGTRWRPWPLTWEWRHRRMRSLLAFTQVEQDGGHGNWHGSDVIDACALMAQTHLEQDGDHSSGQEGDVRRLQRRMRTGEVALLLFGLLQLQLSWIKVWKWKLQDQI